MILEEIRKHIKRGPISRYRISKDTGIDAAALCRIMQGGDCKVQTADKLLEYFDLKLINKYS